MRSMPLVCAAVCLLVAVCHAAPAPATLEAAETPAIAPQNDQVSVKMYSPNISYMLYTYSTFQAKVKTKCNNLNYINLLL